MIPPKYVDESDSVGITDGDWLKVFAAAVTYHYLTEKTERCQILSDKIRQGQGHATCFYLLTDDRLHNNILHLFRDM